MIWLIWYREIIGVLASAAIGGSCVALARGVKARRRCKDPFNRRRATTMALGGWTCAIGSAQVAYSRLSEALFGEPFNYRDIMGPVFVMSVLVLMWNVNGLHFPEEPDMGPG